MPDFHREDDWWRNGQNLYLDNLEATGPVSYTHLTLPTTERV
ncbi:hypothetical protein JMUB7557_27670 [Staphylococcus aureus]